MILIPLNPRKLLHKAFLKRKPCRAQIENFKANLTHLLERTNDTESEEFHKNLVLYFLKETHYKQHHLITTKDRNSLVIYNNGKKTSSVGVIIVIKKPTNKAEMPTKKRLNSQALQELVLYYLMERFEKKNLEIKHLVIANINEWFIFDATLFERTFAQNKHFVKKYKDFKGGRLSEKTTEYFCKNIVEPFIDSIKTEIHFGHFYLREYQILLFETDKTDDKALVLLFKLLSPQHLLKRTFALDRNDSIQQFCSELLHIVGLIEIKEGDKRIIGRNKEGERHSGALLEHVIIQLDRLDKIESLDKPSQFGHTKSERLFNMALKLCITWINRILFLKFLEAQLISFHKKDGSYAFLHLDKIKNYADLNHLFFEVLSKKLCHRNPASSSNFEKVPYLNSSLFEPIEIEKSILVISDLADNSSIPISASTALRDKYGKKRTGKLNTLAYMFEFLDTYDFSNEGSQDIPEDNKTLINGSALGLIFEKMNGYLDGSFSAPSLIDLQMWREVIRMTIVLKFNEIKKWKCADITALSKKIKDRGEANDIVNSIKICVPAVGSGQFFVSALNEIIAVKHELKILQDKYGLRLEQYQVDVINGELMVTDNNGKLFEYNPKNPETQRMQETLFHEKQTIIENCLFCEDVRPNSVRMYSLRLWIELLKSAYYINHYSVRNSSPVCYAESDEVRDDFIISQPEELQTLPNINIKGGNAYVNRFASGAKMS